MNESVSIAEKTDVKKGFSSTRGDKSVQYTRYEPEQQLCSLRSVIGNIKSNGGTPSVDSIATELSSMHTALSAHVLLALQRTHGNRYVQRVVAGIQAKLIVGQSGDMYEQEADRVAEQVMQMPDPEVQRQVEEEEEEGMFQTKPLAEEITPLVQRQIEEEEEEEEEILQTNELTGHNATNNPNLESLIQTIRGGGQPLPESARAYFEPRFGYDFSQVRVHTDAQAAESARTVNARAFTTGQNVVFGAGQYAPGTEHGKKLLAHELTHTIQQAGAPLSNKNLRVEGINAESFSNEITKPTASYQRVDEVNALSGWLEEVRLTPSDEECITSHREGSAFVSGEWYFIIYTRREGDQRRLARRAISQWISWRFGRVPSDMRASIVQEFFERSEYRSIQGDFMPGCQYVLQCPRSLVSRIVRMVRRAQGSVPEEAPSGTVTGTQPEQPGGAITIRGTGPEELAEHREALGALGSAVEQAEVLSHEPVMPVSQDMRVLEDSMLAQHYLDVLEHYTGRAVSADDRRRAQNGLSNAEVVAIVAGGPLQRIVTALYTQGYREFETAGGTQLAQFFTLEETIIEQYVRGNPTATHNHLMIGYGEPERGVLGIVHRPSSLLYYGANGFPLPAFGGTGMRDEGYIGSQQPEQFVINIAAIEDTGLRMLLNALRQTFSDPMRMTTEAAQVYFNNVERVNSEVQRGLSAQIRRKFMESLPFFIGFLAGHGLSTLLMRVPNPVVAGVGLALKGLLTAAGYIMSIDFAGQALNRVLEAAYHLSRVEVNEQGELTGLSERHLRGAASPIRHMVTEIALSIATLALTRALRGRATIECSRCRIRRARAREQRRYGRGQQLGLTRRRIWELRRLLIRRSRVMGITERQHTGAQDHFRGGGDAVILRTINSPQRVFHNPVLDKWVFYRNGTIVITPRNNPSYINTAYGRGGHVPHRGPDYLANLRRLYNNPTLQVGDPEPAVRLSIWIRQQTGRNSVYPIWP